MMLLAKSIQYAAYMHASYSNKCVAFQTILAVTLEPCSTSVAYPYDNPTFPSLVGKAGRSTVLFTLLMPAYLEEPADPILI